jgi:phenylacetate-CoA ligase
MNIEEIYSRVPIIIQNALINIESERLKIRRYGGEYEKIEKEIFERINNSYEVLEEYRLKCLSIHLYKASNTEYWKNIFRKYGVKTESNNPYNEINKLPIITKNEVKNNINKIINKRDNNGIIETHTSGTTGGGMRFYTTKKTEKITWATWWRYRLWHGINKQCWCGYFGGRSIVPIKQIKPPYWRYNIPFKQILFSTYHLSEQTAKYYISELNKSGITWLHGYPSMISLLADYIIEQNLNVPKIRIVTTGAENLLKSQKEKIEIAFNTKVFQHYGQAEGVANISECSNNHLHVDEDFSYVEFIPVENDNKYYRIIGTNWHNHAFPLIRYDTGDIVTLKENINHKCKNKGRVVETIDGRKEDYIFLKNGAKIGRMDHVFKDLINIKEAQIIQKKNYDIIVNIVKNSKYSDKDEHIVRMEFEKRIGKEINIHINYINQIERTKAGKLRFVINEIM